MGAVTIIGDAVANVGASMTIEGGCDVCWVGFDCCEDSGDFWRRLMNELALIKNSQATVTAALKIVRASNSCLRFTKNCHNPNNVLRSQDRDRN